MKAATDPKFGVDGSLLYRSPNDTLYLLDKKGDRWHAYQMNGKDSLVKAPLSSKTNFVISETQTNYVFFADQEKNLWQVWRSGSKWNSQRIKNKKGKTYGNPIEKGLTINPDGH